MQTHTPNDSPARKMRIMVIVGARPNFMKASPVFRAVREARHDAVLVDTGQHYDRQMSAYFLRDLDLPQPDYQLKVGSGSHAVQTARVMEAFEPVLIKTSPHWVVLVGDVNSTLACALVAAKLKESVGCRIAHVEAGLRSNDWRMPEEINRVLTDRLSDVLFTPSRDALPNLLREGIPEDRIRFVGNVMIDTLFARLPAARELNLPFKLGLERGRYLVATVHRPSNVDNPDSLRAIINAIACLARELPVIFPLHPRTRKNIDQFGLADLLKHAQILEPLGYLDMLSLTDGAAAVLTDSGGLQEETTALGVPCVTLRESTERPITIKDGTNQLTPWPLTATGIQHSCAAARQRGRVEPGANCPEGWDGRAAKRIVRFLESDRADIDYRVG